MQNDQIEESNPDFVALLEMNEADLKDYFLNEEGAEEDIKSV